MLNNRCQVFQHFKANICAARRVWLRFADHQYSHRHVDVQSDMHAAVMPSSARLTQVCSSTSVRMWHNVSGRLGVHSRMRGAASCQQDAAGCDRSAAGSVRCSAAAQTYASVAPPASSAPLESQTTFDLACPICADTNFKLHADRCAAVISAMAVPAGMCASITMTPHSF